MAKAEWRTTAGSTICPECGEDPAEVLDPSRLERWRHWLFHGMRLGPSLRCADGHAWPAPGRAAVMRLQHSPGRLASVLRPLRHVLGAVRHHRGITPTPIIYVVAAGLGLVLGGALHLALGWQWWLVALGLVGSVWLFYASTLFWGPGRSDLLSLMAPQRAHRRQVRRLRAQIEAGEVIVYGLDNMGLVSAGGWGSRNERQHSVSLTYGGDERFASVTTMDRSIDDRPTGLIRENVADNLVGATGPKPDQSLPPDDFHAWFERQSVANRQRASELRWEKGSIEVDGTQVPADLVRIDGGSAAVASVDHRVVSVIAVGYDVAALRLVRTTELDSEKPGVFGF